MAENLMDGLLDEMNRVRDMARLYEELGPGGAPGRFMMLNSIKAAEDSIRDGELVAMIYAYSDLQRWGG